MKSEAEVQLQWEVVFIAGRSLFGARRVFMCICEVSVYSICPVYSVFARPWAYRTAYWSVSWRRATASHRFALQSRCFLLFVMNDAEQLLSQCEWRPVGRLARVVTRQLFEQIHSHIDCCFSQAGRNPFPQVPAKEILQFRRPPEDRRGVIPFLRLSRLLSDIGEEDAEACQGSERTRVFCFSLLDWKSTKTTWRCEHLVETFEEHTSH